MAGALGGCIFEICNSERITPPVLCTLPALPSPPNPKPFCLVPSSRLPLGPSRPTFYGTKGRKVTLDYILVRRKWRNSVTDCNHKLPSITSDHNIVVANVTWRLKNNKYVCKSKKDFPGILSNPEVRKQVVHKILSKSSEIGTSYKTFSEVANEVVLAEVPDIPKCHKLLPWDDEEVRSLRSNYRQAQLFYRSEMSDERKVRYLQLSKELSTLYVTKQECFLNTTCMEIMKLHDQDHQSKAVWRAIDVITGRKRSSCPLIAAEDSTERGRLWHSHFSKLLGSPLDTQSVDELPTGVHPSFKLVIFV